ncbi:MAG: rhodanese-like domain-containing protein [Candidatus Aenigmatarchaeota archaeon]
MKNEFGYYDISSAELNDMLSKKDFLLVDVHMPEQKHINGTDIFIPYDELSSNLNKLPTDKNAKIVLYCRSGAMSGVASKNLVSKGYTNIYNLKNGLNEWKSLGYPL